MHKIKRLISRKPDALGLLVFSICFNLRQEKGSHNTVLEEPSVSSEYSLGHGPRNLCLGKTN